jgi:hypothetical protein
MLNAMTPQPGESPEEWWVETGHGRAIADHGSWPRAGTGSSRSTSSVGWWFEVDEMDGGGHLVALSRPAELVERLEAYRTALGSPES